MDLKSAPAAPEVAPPPPGPPAPAEPAAEAAPSEAAAAPAAPPEVQPLAPPSEPAVSTPATARITLKRGGTATGDTFPLGDHVTIGRFDPDSGPVDIDLGALPEAAYVSRHHAEIWRDGSGQWFIKDLGSRNGTFVRSQAQGQFQRISGDQAIKSGDEVALGNARFEFQLQ